MEAVGDLDRQIENLLRVEGFSLNAPL